MPHHRKTEDVCLIRRTCVVRSANVVRLPVRLVTRKTIQLSPVSSSFPMFIIQSSYKYIRITTNTMGTNIQTGADSSMETSAHSDITPITSSVSFTAQNPSSSSSPSSAGMSRLLRAKRSGIDHTLNKAHHRLSLGSSQASAYAGHLSSMVYGKIKSLWSAQTSTANSGLNQLAGTLIYVI